MLLSSKPRIVIVIPARFESSRFPGKPLVDILGKSLIQRVYEKCIKVLAEKNVFIATDDERIRQHCLAHKMQVIMTSRECLTGTDRVQEVSQIIDADLYINVQGDEPLIKPADIEKVISAAIRFPESVINAYCQILNEEEYYSPNVPKVTIDLNGNLLYMSRAAIPANKKLSFSQAYKQVCIYSFPKIALEKFVKNGSKTPIEEIEDIEIIRFLELGFKVKMIHVSNSSIAVDFPQDVEKVIAELKISNES